MADHTSFDLLALSVGIPDHRPADARHGAVVVLAGTGQISGPSPWPSLIRKRAGTHADGAANLAALHRIAARQHTLVEELTRV
ncbi:hypothetical protein [Gryllotalpicola protaetiae]|uniref:Uncharacterized protein n=1 Tax=Gryllotalpicola protaetiae TaxID=2419771 RepID=A0A387BM24_9MICO|nr:hypothetical protein [Gryllotalpicola protaetiae]AYG03432.1 hypothetical protein D7I44_07705 [Gryllotalpicola protaetiae]